MLFLSRGYRLCVKGGCVGAMLKIVSIDYRKYPFLANLDKVIEKYWPGLSLIDFLTTRVGDAYNRAVKVIEDIIRNARVPSPKLSSEEEIISFYIVVLLASLTNNKWLMDRIAIAYSKQALNYLKTESPETITAIAKALGIELEYNPYNSPRIPLKLRRGTVVYKTLPYRMPLKDYLLYSKRLMSDPKYALINQIVDNGYVYTEPEITLRVLGEAITLHIKKLFKPVQEVPKELTSVVEDIKKIVDEVRKSTSTSREDVGEAIVGKNRKGYTRFKGVIVEEAFPPCIKRIIDDLRRGENLSHHERFAVAAFLLRIGMSVDDVLELFHNVPDFNERIARYQVEHIAGLRGSRRQYLPYSCQTMKSLGLCVSDCGGKNPLSVYYRNLKNMYKRRKGKKER